MTKNNYHIPVLSKEIIEYLKPKSNQNFIDATLGDGGHSLTILEKIKPDGQLLAIDLDQEAIKNASERLGKYKNRITFIQDNFINLETIVAKKKFFPINGILFDLGLSTAQLQSSRGFSFQSPGKLDMRFNEIANDQKTAYQIINQSRQDDLAKIFKDYGEIRNSRMLARKIIAQKKEIKNARDLTNLVKNLTPTRNENRYLAQVFQSLRIAVNNELKNLSQTLIDSAQLVHRQGRIAVISYHSLEDRIVKNFFRQESKDCLCPPEIPKCQCEHKASLKIITKKPIISTQKEIKNNSKSRSAKLRIAEKL